jgi:hypothetical protein
MSTNLRYLDTALMADVDPALGQQILDVAQRQRVPHVHHHDQTDDLRRTVEISEWVPHRVKLSRPWDLCAFCLTPPVERPRRRGQPVRFLVRAGAGVLEVEVQGAVGVGFERHPAADCERVQAVRAEGEEVLKPTALPEPR